VLRTSSHEEAYLQHKGGRYAWGVRGGRLAGKCQKPRSVRRRDINDTRECVRDTHVALSNSLLSTSTHATAPIACCASR
jgi:hypothetical protein